MPLLQITATDTGLFLPAAPFGLPAAIDAAPDDPETTIRAALAHLPDNVPVVVLVHGRGYTPGLDGHDPHRLLFAPRSAQNSRRFISWPRRLGFALPASRDPARARGLCIGFGWSSRQDIWTATEQADQTALMLARLVQMVRRADPARRVDLIGHSLGARVILSSLPLLASGSVARVFLLAGADLTSHARTALASPAGRSAEIFNITSRENDLFDLMFELCLKPFSDDPAIGRGLPEAPNWLDIQIDHMQTLQRLAALGFPLPAPRMRICHWSVYLRPGIFRLYRALLHDRERMALDALRAALAVPPEPRWARLRTFPVRRALLSFREHGPTLPG